MKRTAAAVLMLLFLLAACSPAPEVVPTPAAAPTPSPAPEPAPTQLASSPWLEDYNYFWDVIEENYPFYNAVKRITGNDLAKTREFYLAQAQEAKSAQDLFRVLSGCAKDFRGTGHFEVFSPSEYGHHMEVFRHNLGNPMTDYLYTRISTPASLAFYQYTPPSPTPADGGGTESTIHSFAGTERASDNLTFADYPEYNAGYVKIDTMTSSWENDDGETLDAFFRALQAQGYENCIIDICGNGGGDDQFWINNLVWPNLKEPVSFQLYALVRGQQSIDYAAAAGLDLHPIDTLPTGDLPALDPADLEDATHYIIYPFRFFKDDTPPLFSGRFWLLVDQGVYSASEKFALFCKQTGFATLVGYPTDGDGIGINPMLTALPNSGIVFRFSGDDGLNADGSCNEEYGTTPDIVIEDGQDALEVCLEAISAEK